MAMPINCCTTGQRAKRGENLFVGCKRLEKVHKDYLKNKNKLYVRIPWFLWESCRQTVYWITNALCVCNSICSAPDECGGLSYLPPYGTSVYLYVTSQFKTNERITKCNCIHQFWDNQSFVFAEFVTFCFTIGCDATC